MTKEESFGSKQHIVVKFQFIKLSVYREYLNLEFDQMKLPFKYDMERVIDDFILLCFFVGNDFIP
jgi:5'-3' exonuclease